MSDDNAPATPAKRGGRKAPAEKVEKVDRKRTKKEVAAKDDEGASPAKRGRGRPKGTAKKAKAAPKKPAAKTGGRPGRGRPKRKEEEKANSEEDAEENDAGEEEEDDE